MKKLAHRQAFFMAEMDKISRLKYSQSYLIHQQKN
jgi:hypothetical protein